MEAPRLFQRMRVHWGGLFGQMLHIRLRGLLGVWGLVVILLPFPISSCHRLDYHDPFCSGPHRVFRLLRPPSPLLELKLIIYHHYWINCHAKLRPITFSVGRIPVRKAGSNCSLTIIILVLVCLSLAGFLSSGYIRSTIRKLIVCMADGKTV